MKRKVHRNEPWLNLWVMEYSLYQGSENARACENIPYHGLPPVVKAFFAYMDDV